MGEDCRHIGWAVKSVAQLGDGECFAIGVECLTCGVEGEQHVPTNRVVRPERIDWSDDED